MADPFIAEVEIGVAPPDAAILLGAVPDPLLAVDSEGFIRFVNPAAEQFFDAGASHLCRRRLDQVLPFDSPLLELVRQAHESHSVVSEYSVDLGTPRIGHHLVNIRVSPVVEVPGWVLISLRERTIADKMDRQLTHRGAARSVSAMALMLAHEIKNPLSGIRGAAQLLEQNATGADQELTRLIRDEVDRICGLVDRMEDFSEAPPQARRPVNIHQVLDHVRAIAENGFARRLRIVEEYDPSLPPVLGNREQLIQVFLNLVKNAAEAATEAGGEITLGTAFRPGVRLSMPGGRKRLHLPLEVSVQDDGCGIPEELQVQLFDPFITTKPGGSGLGLALVAKIIGDHGGLIEFESEPRRTIFRVLLPVIQAEGRE